MKTIGILGGMSAASTQPYYREICNRTRERLGGLHSPELLIRSLDFAAIEALQAKGEWDSAGKILNREAKALERGGAECLILATNTMHKLAEEMMQGVFQSVSAHYRYNGSQHQRERLAFTWPHGNRIYHGTDLLH